MKHPAISIITTVYNGLPFLKECVASVLKQDFQQWELLISDDGSTDGSRNFLDTLSDERIIVFKQEKNVGIFDNLNFLFKNAKAPVSQILCQDDYFTSPKSLKTILQYWQQAPAEVGFVRFNHRFERTKNLVQYEKAAVPSVIKAGEADIWFYVFGNIPGNLSNVSLRTSIVEQCGYFDQGLPFAGDFEFWSRAARTVGMGVEGEQVVKVRDHKGQASHYLNYNGELVGQKIQVVNEIYKNLHDRYKKRAFALKVHGTFNYDSLDRDMALRALLKKGNRKYITEVGKKAGSAHYTFSAFGRWLLYFLSAGGRMGRVASGKFILSKESLLQAT